MMQGSVGTYGLRRICYDEHQVTIGCQARTPKQWLRLSDRFGRRAGYTDEEITKVRRIIKAIQELQDAIQ